jgi:dihydrofolate reductase
MGNIIVSEFITLDGVIEAPGRENSLGEQSGWSFPLFNEEIVQFKKDDLFASDALLLGRVTYQIHASSWPSTKDEGLLEGLAGRMNSIPKYVVSSTLENLEWNNSRLIKGDILEEIKKLKREISRNILIDGGSDLVNLLRQHDLVDEYRLLVHPIVLGKGKRLFREGGPSRELRLREARTLSSGVVALVYQPA